MDTPQRIEMHNAKPDVQYGRDLPSDTNDLGAGAIAERMWLSETKNPSNTQGPSATLSPPTLHMPG